MKIIFVLLAFAGVSSTFAANITCSFGPATPVPSCVNFNITKVSSADENLIVFGQPSNYVDVNTQSVSFSQTSILNFIPKKLFTIFPKLISFSATNASIIGLVEDNFINCDDLTTISLMYNKISNIPARFASTCHFVQHLHLMYNEIQSIDQDAFQGLESLSYIYMNYNKISCIPPLLFQSTLGLTSIDFSYNLIPALHPVMFNHLTQLCQIQINNNLISYIPNFELHNTCSVGIGSFMMSMSSNPIKAISPRFLYEMFNSRTYFAPGGINIFFPSNDENITICIDPKAYPNNPMYPQIYFYNWVQYDVSLKYRTSCYSSWTSAMEDNSLVTCGSVITPTTTSTTLAPITPSTPLSSLPYDVVPRCYVDFKNRYTCVLSGVQLKITSITSNHLQGFGNQNVERVYFVDSELSRVPPILFDTFTNLKFLSIANCNLGIINDQTFFKCGGLRYLDASYNNIAQVYPTALRNCTSLEAIDLSGNPVINLDTELYNLDPALKIIHLKRESDMAMA